jgi:hypothetical protein
MRLAALNTAGDKAVVRLATDLAARTAIRGVGVQLDAGVVADGIRLRATHLTAFRAALRGAVGGRWAGNAAVSTVLRIRAHLDAGACAVFLALGASCQAFSGRACLRSVAGVGTRSAIARVLFLVHAERATLDEPFVAGAPTNAGGTACHAVGGSVANEPAVAAVERIVGRIHAARAACVVALFTRQSAFRGSAEGAAVLWRRTGHAALPAMHDGAARVDAGACAVGRAGAAPLRTMALGADRACGAFAGTGAAALRITRDIYAHTVAIQQRSSALELTSPPDARGCPAGLAALLTASATVARVLVQIDTYGSAWRVPVVAAEAAAASCTCGVTMFWRSAGRSTTTAVFGVFLEHDAICAAHGLAIATSKRRVTRVAAHVASVTVHAALVRVARQAVQVRGKAASARRNQKHERQQYGHTH